MLGSQNPKELIPFMQTVTRDKNSFLEIGSRYGETLREAANYLNAGAKMHSIELPAAGWGRHDSEPVLADVIEKLYDDGFDAKIFWGDSTSEKAINWAKLNGPYDIIFIDGDHTAAGVTADWENYKDMGSIIVFHDISSHKLAVRALWNKIKKGYRHQEFVDHKATGKLVMGIGALYYD